ncbi:MAG TPA: MFS transporter [Desulfobulbaceae bacterium]|nr:MFS transporter [Desulfobulbaceae bacterium]
MTGGVFAIRNIRLFIAFRVFFNNRFYYPVFTILFVDYGLTVEQFSLLNTIWALTVVAAEVPSGALADAFGRKRLVVLAAALTTVELAAMAFAPTGNASLLFSLFLASRVLSGLADAASSGTDEALAYDSLAAAGLAYEWPKALSAQMRLTALFFVVTSISGAMLYDPAAMNTLCGYFGLVPHLTQSDTMRFPMYAALALAIINLPVALAFQEKARLRRGGFLRQLRRGTANIATAARWIVATKLAMAIIFIGMAYDHILRLIATITSQYFRVCGLAESRFGLVNAAVSVMGLFVPKLAEWLVGRYPLGVNWLITAAISLTGFFLLASFQLWLGITAVLLTFMAMTLTSFFTSHYLNAICDSGIRATVLSFKGMVFNLGYGLAGILFAFAMRAGHDTTADGAAGFIPAVRLFPWYFLVLLAVFLPLCWRCGRHAEAGRGPGSKNMEK